MFKQTDSDKSYWDNLSYFALYQSKYILLYFIITLLLSSYLSWTVSYFYCQITSMQDTAGTAKWHQLPTVDWERDREDGCLCSSWTYCCILSHLCLWGSVRVPGDTGSTGRALLWGNRLGKQGKRWVAENQTSSDELILTYWPYH